MLIRFLVTPLRTGKLGLRVHFLAKAEEVLQLGRMSYGATPGPSTACAPCVASTQVNPEDSKARRKPSLTLSWSSTSKTDLPIDTSSRQFCCGRDPRGDWDLH